MNKKELIETTYTELEHEVLSALENYSNVHRGSGYNSKVTTQAFEQARKIVLDYLGLSNCTVIFCSPLRAAKLKEEIGKAIIQSISSKEIGLPLGVVSLVVKRKDLPKGIPFQTGGGTTRLIAHKWIIWAKGSERFEAGTPAIINIIAFACALKLIRSGNISFMNPVVVKLTADEILYHDELMEYKGKELFNELRHTYIGRNILVPTPEGATRFINLDNAASTPTFTPIWNAVCQTWHQKTEVQQEIVHEFKSICSETLGAPLNTYDVIFTSNTTEAINLAAKSLGRESVNDIEPVILNTLLEHSSNDLPWRMIPNHTLIRLTVDDEGFIDLNNLDSILSDYNKKFLHGNKRIELVTVSGASNVLGTYNDLEEISEIVHKYGAHLFVDAAQLVAHRAVDMEKWRIDYLAFSAHKVYAPFGCGVLVVRKGLLTYSQVELESIRLSGEENTGGIAALGKALVLLKRIGFDVIREEEQALTRQALIGLKQIPGIIIYGVQDPDSPRFSKKGGVIVLSMKGIMPDRIARELSRRGGIGVRYGCHCAHLLVKYLLHVGPFLERFQRVLLTLFPKIQLPGVLRVSFGIENDEADIDKFLKVMQTIRKK